MRIKLSPEYFENDFLTVELPNNSSIVFNIIDEAIKSSSGSTAEINVINIQIMYQKEDITLYSDCTNVIGMSDELISINTDFKEYNGKVLNKDNMKYCEVIVNV